MSSSFLPDNPDVNGPTSARPGARGVAAALFAERLQAQKAITDLKAAGFPPDRIGLALRDQDAQARLQAETGTHAAEGAGVGLATGGLVGGLAGLLIGMGALAIPGIGPVVAGGMLAEVFGIAGVTALAGAGIGAATGGVVGALVGAGLPETEARRLHEGFARGAVLVTVNAGSERLAEAERVLAAHGGDLGRDSLQAAGNAGAAAATSTLTASRDPVAQAAAADVELAGQVTPPAAPDPSPDDGAFHRPTDRDTGSRMTI